MSTASHSPQPEPWRDLSSDGAKPLLLYATTVSQSVRFLRGQLSYMRERGFRVAVLSSPGPELESVARAEGADTIAIWMRRRPAPVHDFVALCRIWAKLRALQPAVVCAGTPKAGLLLMIAAALSRIPLRLYQIRGLPTSTMTGWRRWAFSLPERVACTLAHRVICVSPSVRDEAVQQGLLKRSKAVVLRHGSSNGVDSRGKFDPDQYSRATAVQLQKALRLPEPAQVIGFVGRLVRDKGVVELAQAWSVIRAAHPNTHLVVLGAAEAADAVPPRVLEDLRTDDRVRLLTDRRDSAPYYAIMDVLVHPSHREGFPNVVLEASAMRVPVVTTDATGCVDSVIDGVTGTIVPVRDPGRLAEAVLRYLASPQLRADHGRAGRARVLRHFMPHDLWRALHAELSQLPARQQ